MGLTSWSTSNHLRRLSQVYDTYPFLLSIWGYGTPSGSGAVMMVVGTDGTPLQRRTQLYVNASSQLETYSTDSTTNELATITSPVVPTTTWFHATGEAIAAGSRSVLLNAANKASNVNSLTINPSNCVYVGVQSDQAGAPWWNTGALAEVSIWDCTGMTTGNMDSLSTKLYNGGVGGAGGNPLNITAEAAQPWTGKLKAYWPLTVTTDINDISGNGNHLSMVGTLTNSGNHPTIEAAGDPVGSIRPRTTVSIVP